MNKYIHYFISISEPSDFRTMIFASHISQNFLNSVNLIDFARTVLWNAVACFRISFAIESIDFGSAIFFN